MYTLKRLAIIITIVNTEKTNNMIMITIKNTTKIIITKSKFMQNLFKKLTLMKYQKL
jgi:hypothetical protein